MWSPRFFRRANPGTAGSGLGGMLFVSFGHRLNFAINTAVLPQPISSNADFLPSSGAEVTEHFGYVCWWEMRTFCESTQSDGLVRENVHTI